MIPLSKLFEDEKPSLKSGEYAVQRIDRNKNIGLKAGMMKKVTWLKTDIPPEERSFKNIPKYSTGKNIVNPRDWLEIKARKLNSQDSTESWGWSPNGKCYGWSHRAMYGFGVGDEMKPGKIGSERLKKPFILKTEKQCEEAAIRFAKSVG